MNIDHVEILKALLEGKAIEWKLDNSSEYWLESTQYTNPLTAPQLLWRIKPENTDYNPFKASLGTEGDMYLLSDGITVEELDGCGLSFESREDMLDTVQDLRTMQAYRKAHIESFKDNPPNWTDPQQSKWALVIDGSDLIAEEFFVGIQYAYIFSTRVHALKFVDALGYDKVTNMLKGW